MGVWSTVTYDDGNTESVSLTLIHDGKSVEAAAQFQQLAPQVGGIVLPEDVTLPFVLRRSEGAHSSIDVDSSHHPTFRVPGDAYRFTWCYHTRRPG